MTKIHLENFQTLPQSFYLRDDVVAIARDLVGKYLFSSFDGHTVAGKIVETEAYNGRSDKASHAFMKRTKRTEIMYQEGGFAYVYLCYGIHHLFNIVTNEAGLADAVLIRAVEPIIGIDVMEERRGGKKGNKLTSGPGTLTVALNIKTGFTGNPIFDSQNVWIAKNGDLEIDIEVDRRVGVDYAEEDALLPWRFFEKDNKWVSKKKQKYVDRI